MSNRSWTPARRPTRMDQLELLKAVAAVVDGSGDWRDRALCAETDPDAYFPEKGQSTEPAKQVCRACEVRSECLQDALDRSEPFGIWGGLGERERRRLRHQAAA